MQITKYEHACLVLEKAGKRVIIDPGSYSKSLTGLEQVVAVVITHMHDDHCSEEQLDRILEASPDALIFGTDEVCKRLANYKTTAVHHGDFYTQGGFSLEFFGDLHAEIHRSIPLIQNCGVLVDSRLYYPGDSFTQPDQAVEILACPTSAPWLKISEVMDFVSGIKPKLCFATHNIHLSEIGHDLNNGRIQQVVEAGGGKFQFMAPGDCINI